MNPCFDARIRIAGRRQQLWVLLGCVVLALLAAALPAWRVLRLDVSRLLQAPR